MSRGCSIIKITNEYGERQDRNGYVEDFLKNGEDLLNAENRCYFCPNPNVERHELFHAALRQKSKAYGMWVLLCKEHHDYIHAHPKEEIPLKKQAQIKAMKKYGWSIGDFISRFGKNYVEVIDEEDS